MALSAGVQWDVRTTGSDSNGGGFDPTVGSPGTDYSQQSSAQVAFTDLVIGGTTTQLTSAGNPFSSASVGNIINITGGTGFTTGRYAVTSVTGVIATMDRSVGTGASTGGTGNLGGAFLTVGAAETAVVTAGQIVWLKSGTYTITTTITLPNVAETTIWGYNAAHGDQGTKPVIQSSTSGIKMLTMAGSTAFTLNNVKLLANSGFTQYAILPAGGTQLIVLNCLLTGNGTSNTVAIDSYNTRCTILCVNTEIAGWDTGHFGSSDNNGQFITYIACYIHGNTTAGFGDGGYTGDRTYFTSIATVWDSNGYGIYIQGSSAIQIMVTALNSVFSNSTHDGINNQSAHHNNLNVNTYINNIFYGNGGYGVNAPGYYSGPFGVYGEPALNNGVGANTTANYNGVTSVNDITLTASPFTSSSDFSLNNTSGGGAALKAAGYPGVTPFGTGNIDSGALQHACSGGSDSIVVSLGMLGGIRG